MTNQNLALNGLKNLMLVIFIAAACIFTCYQTYQGYKMALGTIPSLAIALLCSGILFLLALTLRARIKEGGSTLAIWAGCLIVTLVSLPGNFNAFYTGFIRGELVKEELEEKRTALDEIYSKSQTVLADKSFTSLQSEVVALNQQLRSQIMNEGNPGLGEEAQAVISRLEDKLGDNLTPLFASSKNPEALEKLADRYEQNIASKLDARRMVLVENAEERKKAEQDNKQAYDKAITLVDEALSSFATDKGTAAQNNAIHAIQESAKIYSRIDATSRASILDSVAFEYDKKMTLKSDKIGSIDFSLNSAFSHLNHFAVWLSLFLAFFIDIGVPLVVRIIQSNGKDGDDVPVMFANKSTGPRVL